MKRVVITGLGIVSSIGNNADEVLASLKAGKSGITHSESFAEQGLKSNVWGKPTIEIKDYIDRKAVRFMGDAAGYAYIAMDQAVKDAKLTEDQISNVRTGIVAGSGGASSENIVASTDTLRNRGIRRVGPYAVPKTMGSTVSACLATPFKIKGVNYSISSACATSAHCIGNAMELIQLGKQKIIFAGGSDEVHFAMTAMFDAMTALSSKYNDTPEKASRPYDKTRDGFVISGGGGVLVLEEYEHAKSRGAKIYAELTGYGATSDGYDMVAPSGEGAIRCMQLATETVDAPIDYINAHGTSTPVGDIVEIEAIRNLFDEKIPYISSTKSLTGHSLGAAGVQEAIYSLIMLNEDFLVGSANIDNLDEKIKGAPILLKNKELEVNRVMSNSFGFGGTNACLIFEKQI